LKKCKAQQMKLKKASETAKKEKAPKEMMEETKALFCSLVLRKSIL
jgi:hypothetical protein